MVLTRLRLTNWRTHRDLDVEFTPGVNAVVGPNDSGKTNVLRALRCLLLNEGGTFAEVVSHGAQEARVEAWWDTGLHIARVRRAKVNRYIIQDPGAEPVTLDKVGTGPVWEVVERTGVQPPGAEGLELVFQGVGYPSPLDMSPKALAGVLGRLSGAEAVERAGTYAASRYREAGARLKQARDTLEQAEETVGRLAGARDLQPILTRLDAAESVYQAADARESTLLALQERLRGTAPVAGPQALNRMGAALLAADEAARSMSTWAAHEAHLQNLLRRVPATADTSRLGPLSERVDKADAKLAETTSRLAALRGLGVRLEEAESAAAMAGQAVARAEATFQEALGAYDTCPLCGSTLERA